MNKTEIVDLINENDEVVGRASREEVKKNKMLYRCAGIYVEINGKIVIEKRSAKKSIRPLNWSLVEETLKSGETYEKAAARGVKEELGLKAENLEFIGKRIIDDDKYPDRFLLGVFKCSASGKIKIQKSEVGSVQLLTAKEILYIINNEKKVSPGLVQTFNMYLGALK